MTKKEYRNIIKEIRVRAFKDSWGDPNTSVYDRVYVEEVDCILKSYVEKGKK